MISPRNLWAERDTRPCLRSKAVGGSDLVEGVDVWHWESDSHSTRSNKSRRCSIL